MVAAGNYRITTPTLVLVAEDGRHAAHVVPTGAIVTVDGKPVVPPDDAQLVTVMWGEIEAMMFAQDLQNRAERITSNKAKAPKKDRADH